MPLQIKKESVLEPNSKGNLLQYVAGFKERLQSACKVAKNNLATAKERMKQFNHKAEA